MQTVPDNLVLPPRTLTGVGRVRELLAECGRMGKRGVLVYGKSLKGSGELAAILENKPHNRDILEWQHPGGEPTLYQLRSLLKEAREFKAEWIAAVGGGSVLDIAKACAGLFNTAHDPSFYHDGNAVDRQGIPFIAVPTTAGSGSEATPNAVLTNTDKQAKKSIRHDSFVAHLVILDAGLLKSCPRNVIAASGMDALTQAIEAFTSRKASWFSDQLARKGLALIANSLPSVFVNPGGHEAEDLLLGSYFTGIGLSIARLGVIHGIAHPLGVFYNQPHGLVCAACLPHALALNRDAVGTKYGEMSAVLNGDPIETVQSMNQRLGIVSPFRGKAMKNRETIVSEALASGSTAANPRKITADDVNWLLEKLFAE